MAPTLRSQSLFGWPYLEVGGVRLGSQRVEVDQERGEEPVEGPLVELGALGVVVLDEHAYHGVEDLVQQVQLGTVRVGQTLGRELVQEDHQLAERIDRPVAELTGEDRRVDGLRLRRGADGGVEALLDRQNGAHPEEALDHALVLALQHAVEATTPVSTAAFVEEEIDG